ncbi:MAG: hypothetical protein ACR2FM_04895 [Candidatus Saccharimonadales bacterium]
MSSQGEYYGVKKFDNKWVAMYDTDQQLAGMSFDTEQEALDFVANDSKATPNSETASELEKILESMVEDTVMFLTNDLPSLLQQDYVTKIRRVHKDEILKNMPTALSAIHQHKLEWLESILPTYADFIAESNIFNRPDYWQNGYTCGVAELITQIRTNADLVGANAKGASTR